MKSTAVHRIRPLPPPRNGESGVTIVLVAAAMVAIMGMAALSIDVATLYLANAEAQRSADAAALAAARVLSISGMTGDPSNSAAGAITNPWQQACALATSVATAVASQNTMGGVTLNTSQISVTYPNNSDTATCTGTTPKFGVNPLVTVKVQRTDLPTFFARIWGRTGASVSATATAEAFNSSDSGDVAVTGKIIPVQPRCVKPWVVPNKDPGNAPGSCTGGCPPFVNNSDGSISTAGIRVNNAGTGVIGRTFNLFADCNLAGECVNGDDTVVSPGANVSGSVGKPNLQYIPGQLPASFTAVPSCAVGSDFQEAVAGCDQTTVYQCGIDDQTNTVDLGQDNVGSDSALAGRCLIGATGDGLDMGQDSLDPSSYPYKIKAGSANPLGLSPDSVITSSNSIVSFPIYDNTGPTIRGNGTSPVTIIGFLQVFINYVDTTNNFVNVTVLNVAGCGNGTNSGTPVSGTSPVPVRLITYP
jgi:Flp pilus assembly protein TadG